MPIAWDQLQVSVRSNTQAAQESPVIEKRDELIGTSGGAETELRQRDVQGWKRGEDGVDSDGLRVDFRHTVIVVTTNVGSDLVDQIYFPSEATDPMN